MSIFEAIMNVFWGAILGANLIVLTSGQADLITLVTTLLAVFYIIRNTNTIYLNSREKKHE